MKARLFVALFVFYAAALAAQTPGTSPPAAQIHTNDLGFSYSLPSDWEVVDTQPKLSAVIQQAGKDYGSDAEKMAACIQLPLTGRHGNPASVIAVVGLSFDCMGHTFAAEDLPGIGFGVSEGLKKNIQVVSPVNGAYMLGTHSMWIERSSGTLISHPEIKRTMETVCSVLRKGIVCWMIMAADDATLQIFEKGQVTLDGDAATALVPVDAFSRKP